MMSNSKTTDRIAELHARIVKSLTKRIDMRVMSNDWRGHYVECMIAMVLGEDWTLPWEKGEDWASWDIEHKKGAKIEVKQSSARQTWHRDHLAPRKPPSFDIAPRSGYWTDRGNKWVDSPGRPADIYIMAWHGERDAGIANHTDPEQWRFYVVATRDLPENQKTMGLRSLKKISSVCDISDLKRTVEDKLDTLRL